MNGRPVPTGVPNLPDVNGSETQFRQRVLAALKELFRRKCRCHGCCGITAEEKARWNAAFRYVKSAVEEIALQDDDSAESLFQETD